MLIVRQLATGAKVNGRTCYLSSAVDEVRASQHHLLGLLYRCKQELARLPLENSIHRPKRVKLCTKSYQKV